MIFREPQIEAGQGLTGTRRACDGEVLHMEAYCLKCREKREMKDPNPITMKNGKPATEGTCPVCGTRMFKIGKTAAHS